MSSIVKSSQTSSQGSVSTAAIKSMGLSDMVDFLNL